MEVGEYCPQDVEMKEDNFFPIVWISTKKQDKSVSHPIFAQKSRVSIQGIWPIQWVGVCHRCSKTSTMAAA